MKYSKRSKKSKVEVEEVEVYLAKDEDLGEFELKQCSKRIPEFANLSLKFLQFQAEFNPIQPSPSQLPHH